MVNAGIILLGFGGARWTKEYAVAYLKFAVGAGFKLFLTQLIITIGGAILEDWLAFEHANNLAGTPSTLRAMMMLASVSVIMTILVGKIPGMAQSMIQGVPTSGGDELAAPAKMVAAGTVAFTGVGATVAAAKSAASTAMGGFRAMRAASVAASAGIKPTTGFGNRVGAAVASTTGSTKLGNAIGHLAQAARGDVANVNSGGNRRGTLGGRMASAIRGLSSDTPSQSNDSKSKS
jgi:type IV secretion system protein TrbL